jgi:hypothetical protein
MKAGELHAKLSTLCPIKKRDDFFCDKVALLDMGAVAARLDHRDLRAGDPVAP